LLGVVVVAWSGCAEPRAPCFAVLRAAAIAAVAGRLFGVSVGRWLVSAGGGWQRFEAREGGGELGGPWPCALKVELRAASGERQPGGDMQQSVAQPLGLGLGELAVEQQRLGPDDQVVREPHDLQPRLVERELLERELGQAGVLVVADPVLDVGVLTVAALDDRDVLIVLVGEDRLEAVAVVVGERQLRAGCGRSRPTISLDPSGQEDRSTRSVISATSPLARSLPSWSSARTQASSGICRIAARTCSVSS
jgi:hypothetical protein